MSEKVKVTVVGSGYVGMSLAVLLAQHNDVTVHDIDPGRDDHVNRRNRRCRSGASKPFLKEKELSLSATLDVDERTWALNLWWCYTYQLRP
jgi:UDPglucose 6-dehydrogenase